jgi:hypothetical protein
LDPAADQAKERGMDNDNSNFWKKQQDKWLSRRNLIRGTVGTAAGAGLLLGSGLRLPALADDEDEGEHNKCRVLPRPIPHINTPPGTHFFFAGPVTGVAAPTDPSGVHPNGRDPSTITDFKGKIAQADLFFSGTGTDLNTGHSASYGFHTDWRFMTGVFVGVDGLKRHGTLSFI